MANALRMLRGCHKGAPSHSLINVVWACVVATMTYAAEGWYHPPGYTKKRMSIAIESMDRALRVGLRAALPAFCTTPSELLHHAANVPSMRQILDHTMRRHALRIQRLDPEHPLRKRKDSM